MLDHLASSARYEIAGFLSALAFFLSYQMLSGAISTHGLLSKSEDGGPSPNEVQLLFFTLVAAGTYLLQVIQAKDGKLPDVPPAMLAILVTSQGVYTAANGLPSFIDWLTGRKRPEGKSS